MSTVDFEDVLFQLLPPGDAYSKEDTELMGMIGALAKEFGRYFEWITSIADSIPDRQGIALSKRWEAILGTKNLAAKLAERGIYVGDSMVTGTAKHFAKLAELRKLVANISKEGPFRISISGLKWRGRGHPDNLPAVEDFVSALLKLKPAHLWVELKE